MKKLIILTVTHNVISSQNKDNIYNISIVTFINNTKIKPNKLSLNTESRPTQ